jgi:hypothetical protein
MAGYTVDNQLKGAAEETTAAWHRIASLRTRRVASRRVRVASHRGVVAWHLARCGVVSWHRGLVLYRIKGLRNNEIIILL